MRNRQRKRLANSEYFRHFSPNAGTNRVFYPPARPSSLSKVHVFGGGSLGEFYEPSGEGKQEFSLPGKLALLACRPSRELVDFLVFSNAREGEINFVPAISEKCHIFHEQLVTKPPTSKKSGCIRVSPHSVSLPR